MAFTNLGIKTSKQKTIFVPNVYVTLVSCPVIKTDQ